MYSLNAPYGEAHLRSVGVTASEQHVQQGSLKVFSAVLGMAVIHMVSPTSLQLYLFVYWLNRY